jgi:putative tryptophan/tyrosine transport system substrate-binding protein
MRRRDFVTLLGGSVIVWPVAAPAQPGKLPTVGFMGADPVTWRPWTDAFVKRLGELGWTENKTVAIAYRWNEGLPDRTVAMAAELVGLKPDVIVTAGEAAVVKKTTSDIPIVFAAVADPVGNKLVANLEHPGANVTGVAIQAVGISSNQLALLLKVVPQLHRLGVIFDASNYTSTLEAGDLQATARKLGLEVTAFGARSAPEIVSAFAKVKPQADALCVPGSIMFAANRSRIIALAMSARLPTMFGNRDYVQAGGLMSCAPSLPAQFRHAAELVDKILRGTQPGDIPVEQPNDYDLVVNLATAKALGLTIPAEVRANANAVIE